VVARRNPPPVIAGGDGGGWQYQALAWNGSPWTLGATPGADDSGDALLTVTLNGVAQARSQDYTLTGAAVTWIGLALEATDVLAAWYAPSD